MGGAHRQYKESRVAGLLGVWVFGIVILLALSPIWPVLLWLALVLAVLLAAILLGVVVVYLVVGHGDSHGK